MSAVKTLFVFPHPDDEIACLGYLQSLFSFDTRALWISNGDTVQGKSRRDELERAASSLQEKGLRQAISLEYSEWTHFQRLFARDIAYFRDVEARIDAAVVEQGTDLLITNAFQGGNIMHDIVNVLTHRVAQKHGRAAYEFPAYHLGFGISLHGIRLFSFGRFGRQNDHRHPEKGFVHYLTDEQLEEKIRHPSHYPQAAPFFAKVRKETEHDMRLWREEHYRHIPPTRTYSKPTPLTLYEVHGYLAKRSGKVDRVATFSDFRDVVERL